MNKTMNLFRSKSRSKTMSMSKKMNKSRKSNLRNSMSRSKSLNHLGFKTRVTEDILDEIKETMKKLYKNAKEDDMYHVKKGGMMETEDDMKHGSTHGGATHGGAMRGSRRSRRSVRSASPPAPLTEAELNSWRVTGRWPGNYGCRTQANKKEYVLQGTLLDRFGGDWGVYLGKPVDSFISRSMNRISNRNLNKYQEYYTSDKHHLLPATHKYHLYEVNKPIYTFSCIAAAAFDKPGGAKQFLVPAIHLTATELPLSLSDEHAELVDPNVGPTRFYKVSYLVAQNVLTEVAPTRFPPWN